MGSWLGARHSSGASFFASTSYERHWSGALPAESYSTVTFAAIATAFQTAMSLRMKAANSSGELPTVCIA